MGTEEWDKTVPRRRILRWRNFWIALGLLVVAVTGYSLYVGLWYYPDAQDTVILGQTSLYADSPGSLRVLVRDQRTGRPVQGASVTVSLDGTGGRAQLGRFVTGKDGTFSDQFVVPALPPATYRLTVEAASAVGKDAIVREVAVKRSGRLYLTTDKPIYQPGQTLHMRALVLNRVTLAPLRGEQAVFEVEDPKGNKVCKTAQTTSAYGIASADFEIADSVNLGRYKLRVLAGGVSSEKTVTVARYVLPKFRVRVSTDRPWHLPAETLSGTVAASHFFGKPVAGGRVELTGRTMVEQPVEVFKLTGQTDDAGVMEFSLPLPRYFTGVPLAGRDALLNVEAVVTDNAGHAEHSAAHLTVAADPIKVQVLPESGEPVPGVDNLVYILTTYPDGTPAECRIELADAQLDTDASGLAVLSVTPPRGTWTPRGVARDKAGRQVAFERALKPGPEDGDFLLRTDKALYSGGEAVNVTLLSTARQGTYFLDVIKDGQTMLTRTLELQRGRAAYALDLPPSLFGTLKLTAYAVTASGESLARARVIQVGQARGLRIATALDRETYRPGDEAQVRFAVTDAEGRPCPAALGVSAVDEAVYALSENRPGLLAQFFMADEELLRPAYQIKFAVPPERLLGGEGGQRLAQALFSAAATGGPKRLTLDDLVAQGYIDERTADYIKEARAAGEYDQLRDDPEFRRALDLLQPRGEYTLSATTYEMKRAQAEAYCKRYFDALKAIVGFLFVLAIALTPTGIFALVAWNLTATEAERGLDPMRAAVERAANWLVHSCWLLMQFTLFIYVGALIAAEPISGALHSESAGKAVLWAALGAEALFTAAVLLHQTNLCRRLMSFEQTRERGLCMLAVPKVYGVQYVASRALIVACIVRLLPPTVALVAGMVSVGAWMFALGLASDEAIPAAMVHKVVLIGRRRWWEYLLALVIIMLMCAMCMPALGRARREARLSSARADMHNLDLALEMAERDRGTAPGEEPTAPIQRIREHFPETLLWQPEVITDDSGRATLSVPLADSITDWRMSVDAVSAGGALGSAESPIHVFQDFFVDLDLPVALTQNDEVSIPVACYNYLSGPQTVRLSVEAGDWCELQGAAETTVNMAPNEVRSVHFRLKALDVGRHELTVLARGERMSDAVRRQVRVKPDGTPVETVQSGTLTAGRRATGLAFVLPDGAVPGSQSLLLKVYPTTFSEVVEGLENVFKMPYGCFEQTSSCTYPNAMALLYMRRTGQSTPEVEVKAQKFINAGYQRLLTFEVPGGGFEWFGQPPANVVLTAYGILEFTDMAKVHEVDPAVVERAKTWLFSEQGRDGAWDVRNPGWTWEISGNLITTAYVAWALAEAGAGRELDRALDYLRAHVADTEHTYTLALTANAFLARDPDDPDGRRIVERLQSAFIADGDGGYFASDGAGAMYSRGYCLSVETTALAALAMMKNGSHSETVKKALTWISRQRDPSGTWSSTQATILAMKALLQGTGAPLGGGTHARLTVEVNGRPAGAIEVTPETSDLLHALDLTRSVAAGRNAVVLRADPPAELPYRLVGEYWTPWKTTRPEAAQALEIAVGYDKARLAVNDVMTCSVTVKNNTGSAVGMAIIDLGVPPGFSVDTAAFEKLVGAGRLAKYDVTGNQCILYVRDIPAARPLRFDYELRALYPIRAKAPPSRVYEYYNPQNEAVAPGQQLIVE